MGSIRKYAGKRGTTYRGAVAGGEADATESRAPRPSTTGLTRSAGRWVASISYPRSSAMSPASRIAVSSVTRFNHNVIGLSRSSAGM